MAKMMIKLTYVIFFTKKDMMNHFDIELLEFEIFQGA